jgi:hypothetical protein
MRRSTIDIDTGSPAADERDDFEPVPLVQDAFRVSFARDDLKVSLDSQKPRRQLEQFDELGDARSRGDLARVAVDDDLQWGNSGVSNRTNYRTIGGWR